MIKALCSALVIYGLISATWAGVELGQGFTWFALWVGSFGGFATAMGFMLHGYVNQAELELRLARTAVENMQSRGRP